MDRRGFLKFLGLGAAVAPVAAVTLPKVAAEIEAQRRLEAVDKMVNPPLLYDFRTDKWVGITYIEKYNALLGNSPKILRG